VRSFGFILREFVHGLNQQRFLHFTYGAQVTISLMVLGVFFVMLVGAAVLWQKMGQQLKVHVFLEDGLSGQQINLISDQLAALENVSKVTLRSKQEALEVFAEQNKSINLRDLELENPLPDSYIVEVNRPANIQGVVDQADQFPGVLSIRYGQQIVSRYIRILALLVGISAVTILLLVLFTYSSINNIIGLSIYARRSEIRIMQLVGATWWFIRWPFLFEGVFFGLAGAIVSLLVIYLLVSLLGEAVHLSELSLAIPTLSIGGDQILLALTVLLLGLGVFIGFFASFNTINNFLSREAEATQMAARMRQLAK
jgi:cell division transport system permease protein